MRFGFKPLDIPDVILIEPHAFYDERGFFMEIYRQEDFSRAGIREAFVQDAHSCSVKKHVLRGLHYQNNPMAQAKIVRVICGEVFDVAVDIRKGSPYYGKWVSLILSAENKHMLYIPKGFAHGFCNLTEKSELLYKFSNVHSPDCERSILWNDPALGIKWPLDYPVVSQKDAQNPTLDKADNNFIYK